MWVTSTNPWIFDSSFGLPAVACKYLDAHKYHFLTILSRSKSHWMSDSISNLLKKIFISLLQCVLTFKVSYSQCRSLSRSKWMSITVKEIYNALLRVQHGGGERKRDTGLIPLKHCGGSLFFRWISMDWVWEILKHTVNFQKAMRYFGGVAQTIVVAVVRISITDHISRRMLSIQICQYNHFGILGGGEIKLIIIIIPSPIVYF